MKKIGILLGSLLVSLFVFIPTVLAEEPVDVYLFRGEGCPHCQEFEEWLDSLDSKTKAKFNIIDYEVWYNKNNSDLMTKVADVFGDTNVGVPYIIVGDETFIGYTSSYATAILGKIDSLYNVAKSERYDVMQHLDEIKDSKANKKENDSKAVVIIIIFLVVVAGGALIYMVSKSN